MATKRRPTAKTTAHHPTRKAKGVSPNDLSLPSGYLEALEDIKARVRAARIRASLSVNRELIILYWEIGHLILQRQQTEGWGTKVIDRLSVDLNREFPDQKGFSARNLKYMRKFAECYPDKEIVQQPAAQIPWFHNCAILDKVQDAVRREWYTRATIEYGWSRAVLVHQIDSDLYARQGRALTNFPATPPVEDAAARCPVAPGDGTGVGRHYRTGALCTMFTPPALLNRVPSGCSTGVKCEAYSSGVEPIALGPSALRPSLWGPMLHALCSMRSVRERR